MRRWLLAALVVVGVAIGAFFIGRGSVDRTPAAPVVGSGSFADGYRSGREAAFSGFDGGWSFDTPYIVTLKRAGSGITYRFERRWTMEPGVEYRACGHTVCTRRP
jgi:hypothetical protein